MTATATANRTNGTHGRPVSDNTVRSRLRHAGLRASRPYIGLVLTRRHRRQRLNWARRHLRWTRAQWGRMLFTDESRFKLRRADGLVRMYRRRGERFQDCCVVERDMFGGGSIMVWAGISMHTKTGMVRLAGNLNAARYRDEIIRPVLLPHIQANGPMVFMQDNARPHTARDTIRLLQANNIRMLDWPACSPDLNPIEHVWDEIDRRVRRMPAQQDLAQLERDILQVWRNLPQHFLQNYINSMRSRCLAVINAQGDHTRY